MTIVPNSARSLDMMDGPPNTLDSIADVADAAGDMAGYASTGISENSTDRGRGFAGRPALRIERPSVQKVPIVVASPHSGRDYPLDLGARDDLDGAALRSSEDGFIDEVFAGAVDIGAPLISALFPRVYVDVNRAPRELDPAMFSEPLPDGVTTRNARIAAGLGTIARVVANAEPIYDRKLSLAEVEARLQTCYHPYHSALRELIDQTREKFGVCLLIDAHSMPSAAVASGRSRSRAGTNGQDQNQHGHQNRHQGKGNGIDMVLGDCHGVACHPLVMGHVEAAMVQLGYRVRRNNPYAGGFVTRHYGQPAQGVHALQIEINRGLYMDEERIERRPELPDLAADMRKVLSVLAEVAPSLSLPTQAD
jgi:N-formylglutamate amidohydrolase